MGPIDPQQVLYEAVELLSDWSSSVDPSEVAGWLYHPLYQDATQSCGRLAAYLLLLQPEDAQCQREARYLAAALRAIMAAARRPAVDAGIVPAAEGRTEAWDEFNMGALAMDMAAETRQMFRQTAKKKQPPPDWLLSGKWRSCLQEPRPEPPRKTPPARPNGSAPGATGPTG